jgi:hypothetical protein
MLRAPPRWLSVRLHAAFHPRAAEDAAAIDAWWKRNRPAAPNLFEDELEEVVGLLLDAPTLGSLADPSDDDFPGVRRAVMRRTRYYGSSLDFVRSPLLWVTQEGFH